MPYSTLCQNIAVLKRPLFVVKDVEATGRRMVHLCPYLYTSCPCATDCLKGPQHTYGLYLAKNTARGRLAADLLVAGSISKQTPHFYANKR
jgi:hypothetical protein